MMQASGWKGVHALDAIAHGDGPNTFADLVTQEFQWARSLVMILLQYTPAYIGRLSPNLKFQFLFAQLWYSLFSLSMALWFLLPIIALRFYQVFVNVPYLVCFVYFFPPNLMMIALAYQWRSYGVYRPANTKVISWEMVAFVFLRWPWMLLGSVMAVHDWWRGKYVDFRVTPKGHGEESQLPFRVVLPYVLLSLLASFPALTISNAGAASGFYLFAIMNAAVYALLSAVIVMQHTRENGLPWTDLLMLRPLQVILVAALILLPMGAVNNNGMQGVQSIAWGAKYFTLTKVAYTVVGADHRTEGRISFAPQWTYGKD